MEEEMSWDWSLGWHSMTGCKRRVLSIGGKSWLSWLRAHFHVFSAGAPDDVCELLYPLLRFFFLCNVCPHPLSPSGGGGTTR